MAQKKSTKAERNVSDRIPRTKRAAQLTKNGKGTPSMAKPKKETPQEHTAQNTADMRVNLGDIMNGFATSSSHVVLKAASILEEEIAAGIIAAKEVEKKFINVKKIRSRPNDEIIQRFRRDSHEIVDILLDLLDVSLRHAGGVAKSIINVRGWASPMKKEEGPSREIPVLNMPAALAPGATGTISMLFENSQNTATGIFKVVCTDLLSSRGGTIPASNISFSPATIDIGPRAQQEIGITVHVPAEAKSDAYSGLIQATNIEQLRAILVVTVQ